MDKTTFRVTHRPDGSWQGLGGDGQLIVVSHTQDLVKVEVFKVAKELGNSRVLVFDTSGDEVEERTFGPAAPKGYAGDWG